MLIDTGRYQVKQAKIDILVHYKSSARSDIPLLKLMYQQCSSISMMKIRQLKDGSAHVHVQLVLESSDTTLRQRH